MGLERLNVLFFLINATGGLPHRMVLDKRKKCFKFFDVGWCHPATWWFVVVLFIQIIYTPYNTTKYIMQQISERDKKETVIYEMAMVLWVICYGIVKLIPVIVLFRIRNLMTALTDLNKVDQILNKISNKPRCSSRQRTVIGFVCAISLIVTFEISVNNQLLLHQLETKEIIYKLLNSLADFIALLEFATWLLLFHLTYYSISHRIAILGYLIGDEAPITRGKKITVVPINTINIEHNTDEQLRFRLQKVDYVIDRLAKTCNQLKCVFSFPALIILLTSLLSCTINIFVLLRKFIQPNSSDEMNIISLLVILTQQIAMALVVIVSADMPAKEVKRLRSKFLRLSTKKIDAIDEAKCAAILLGLSEERFQLSAGGLMPIGKELLPSLIASVITYLVILLQNAVLKKANQDKGKVNG